MIQIFQLTEEEQKELDSKLNALGPIDVLNPAPHVGVFLRFQEDIHLKRLMGDEVPE